MISIKSQQEIDCMKKAGCIAHKTLRYIATLIEPGVTTNHIDRLVEDFIKSHGATPSFKGYEGFPKSICTSLNNEVVHGIPGNIKINDGDILSVDVGVCINGYHSDCARTYAVGDISDDAKQLIDVTRQSFYEGIRYAKEGYRLSDISHAIQEYAESFGYSLVRDLTGHGIGKKLHEDPEVPNFGKPGRGPRLYKGMTLAIEPMVNMGSYAVSMLPNDWTIVTRDGKLSAHYENTILITTDEPVILSKL